MRHAEARMLVWTTIVIQEELGQRSTEGWDPWLSRFLERTERRLDRYANRVEHGTWAIEHVGILGTAGLLSGLRFRLPGKPAPHVIWKVMGLAEPKHLTIREAVDCAKNCSGLASSHQLRARLNEIASLYGRPTLPETTDVGGIASWLLHPVHNPFCAVLTHHLGIAIAASAGHFRGIYDHALHRLEEQNDDDLLHRQVERMLDTRRAAEPGEINCMVAGKVPALELMAMARREATRHFLVAYWERVPVEGEEQKPKVENLLSDESTVYAGGGKEAVESRRAL